MDNRQQSSRKATIKSQASLRRFWLAAALFAALLAEAAPALAQIETCQSLAGKINNFNRSSDFRALQANVDEARAVSADLQDVESLFVRGGCQQVLDAGNTLNTQCRTVARRILKARQSYNEISAKIQLGQAVGRDREALLQQYARFACGSGSSANIEETSPFDNRSPLETLFGRLFGGSGDSQVIDEGWGYYGQSTLRSVCVRTCDGYFWPVSFSTIEQYLPNDASQCQQQCPGAAVDLYFYHNPGEDPEDMINLAGEAYKALPAAFRYRSELDKSCTCKPQVQLGSIQLASVAEGGQSRAVIEFGQSNFPLPLRDPRQVATGTPIAVANLIHVPLPRHRPPRPGEDQTPLIPMNVPVAQSADRRIQSNGRTVRIVGPDTPYAQSAAAGT